MSIIAELFKKVWNAFIHLAHPILVPFTLVINETRYRQAKHSSVENNTSWKEVEEKAKAADICAEGFECHFSMFLRF
jgi:hypothetical protein